MTRQLALAAVAAISGVVFGHAAPPASSRLTIEQLIEIRHPSSPMWSPDGQHAVFVWDRAGVSKVYVADANGSGAPRELSAAGATLSSAFWSTDGKAFMTIRNGDLWRVPIDGSAASPVWTTPETETNVVPSPDGSHVAFVRSESDPSAAASASGSTSATSASASVASSRNS